MATCHQHFNRLTTVATTDRNTHKPKCLISLPLSHCPSNPSTTQILNKPSNSGNTEAKSALGFDPQTAKMSHSKYAYPYYGEGYYQGPPPPVVAPPQYAAAPPQGPGCLEACLAALCCCCLVDQCCWCCDPFCLFAF